MNRYAIKNQNGEVVNTVVADEDFVQANYPGLWELVPDDVPAPVVNPTEWLINVGPFFDRFGPAKLAVLAHTDPLVQALIKDLQVRVWIDLQRADVAQGIDLLISKGVPGVNAALKTAILTTPVAPDENLVLRREYLS